MNQLHKLFWWMRNSFFQLISWHCKLHLLTQIQQTCTNWFLSFEQQFSLIFCISMALNIGPFSKFGILWAYLGYSGVKIHLYHLAEVDQTIGFFSIYPHSDKTTFQIGQHRFWFFIPQLLLKCEWLYMEKCCFDKHRDSEVCFFLRRLLHQRIWRNHRRLWNSF